MHLALYNWALQLTSTSYGGKADVPSTTTARGAHEIVAEVVGATLATWTDADVSTTTRASAALKLRPKPIIASNTRSGVFHGINRSISCGARGACRHRELHTIQDATLVAWRCTTVAAARAALPAGEVVPEGILTTSAPRSNANISATRCTWIAPELVAFSVDATLRSLLALHRRKLDTSLPLAALASRGCTSIATTSASCAASEIIPECVLTTHTACGHANVATTLAVAAWEGLVKTVCARYTL